MRYEIYTVRKSLREIDEAIETLLAEIEELKKLMP
jgi:hypothetical protein